MKRLSLAFGAILLIAAPCAGRADQKSLEKVARLADQGKFQEAERLLDAVQKKDPTDKKVFLAAEMLRQKQAQAMITEGETLLRSGSNQAAQEKFARAYSLDPQNEYARQRFHDARPESSPAIQTLQLDTEPQLIPKRGLHTINYRGDSRGLVTAFAREFGLNAEFDPNFGTRPVRFILPDATYAQALQAVTSITKSFIVPLSTNQFLIASDDPEARRRLERMSLRTFIVPDATNVQDLVEVVNVLRMMFDLRQIMPNQATHSVTVRAPGADLDAAQRLLEDMSAGRPEVMIDVQVVQVKHTEATNIGIDLPLQFSAFNVNTELRNLVTDPNLQSLIDQIAAGGKLTPQQAAALAAFVSAAQNSSSPLLKGFVTFGGGVSRTGVSIPPAGANFKLNSSDVKIYQRVTLRAQHGAPATYRIGDRYPVLTGTFSPLVNIPLPPGLAQQNNTQPLTPSFQYEDLGITFKATPTVGASDAMRIDFDLALRALAGETFNGVPAISNRQYTGSLTLREGETSVIAGSVNQSEQKSIRGLPLLSEIPGLREAVSTTTRDKTDDQLLLLVTAHKIRSGHGAESPDIPLPPSGSAQ